MYPHDSHQLPIYNLYLYPSYILSNNDKIGTIEATGFDHFIFWNCLISLSLPHQMKANPQYQHHIQPAADYASSHCQSSICHC